MEEAEGPALDELLSQDSPATDRSVTMGDDEEETEEMPGIPMPELEPLSEVREVARWVDDLEPLAYSFLVCRSVRSASDGSKGVLNSVWRSRLDFEERPLEED